MSKEQKLAFIKALKYEGLKVKRADGRLIITRPCGDLVVQVDARPSGTIELTSCSAGTALVKACLMEALA
jgi:hypothetical protein